MDSDANIKEDKDMNGKRKLFFKDDYRRPRKVIRIHIESGEKKEYTNAYWAAESIVTSSTNIRVVCDRNEGLKRPQFQRRGYYFIWGN